MKLSVIVPVFRVEKYINKCVESLINQSYKDMEIILVDDGGDDSCPKICDEYAQKYENITVVHKENGGLSSARNAGIKVAKGEYIAFHDGDDYCHRDTYKILMEEALKYSVDICQMGNKKVYNLDMPTDSPIGSYKTKVYTTKKAIDYVFVRLKKKFFKTSACANVYKREIFERISFREDVKYREDATIKPEFLLSADTFASIGVKLYYYVQTNTTSLTHNEKKYYPEMVKGNICVNESLIKGNGENIDKITANILCDCLFIYSKSGDETIRDMIRDYYDCKEIKSPYVKSLYKLFKKRQKMFINKNIYSIYKGLRKLGI